MSKRILFCVAVALFISLLSADAMASLRASGTFSYRKNSSTIGGVTTESSRFVQSYRAGIRRDITETIDMGLSIMWYFVETDTGKDSSYSPVLTFNFNPPGMYNFTFGHSRTDSDPSEGQHVTSTITYTTFTLPQSKWPSLNISYSLSENYNHTSPKTMDSDTSSLGLSSGYAFEGWEGTGSVNYSFGDSVTNENISGISSESITHSLGGNFSRSVFNDKVEMSVFSGISRATQIYESSAAPSLFTTLVTLTNGLACFACVGTVAIETELVDNNAVTPVVPNIDIGNANWHIGLDTGAINDVAALEVFVSTTVAEEALIASTYNFGWQLYSSVDNVAWTSMGAIVPTYDTFYHMFRFDFPKTNDRYFKVVNTAGQGVAINVTEIRAFTYLLSTPDNRAEVTSDSISMGLRLSYSGRKGHVSYSLSMSHSKRDTDNSKSTSMNHGLSGGYTVIPRYLSLSGSLSLMLSQSSRSSSADSESGNLSYALSASSRILPTIRGSFSYSHNENSYNGRKRHSSDSFGLSANLDIYKGVGLRLSSYMSQSKYLVAKRASKSEAFSASLSLSPWKRVSVKLNSNVSKSSSKSPTGSSSSSSDALSGSLNIRLTKSLYYGNSFTIEPSQSERHSVGWRLTRVLNVRASYSVNDFTESKSLSVAWAPVPKAGFSLAFSESERLWDGSTSNSMSLNGHITFL